MCFKEGTYILYCSTPTQYIIIQGNNVIIEMHVRKVSLNKHSQRERYRRNVDDVSLVFSHSIIWYRNINKDVKLGLFR